MGATLAAALLLGGAPAAHGGTDCLIQLFFSAADPFEGTGRTPPVLPGNVVGMAGSRLNTPPLTNPAIDSGRLWIWATGPPGNPEPHNFDQLALVVSADGPATITGGGMLIITSPTPLRRWETGSDLTPPSFNLIAVTRAGVQLPPLGDGWDDGVASVLLGYLDFEANGGVSTVWFQVGSSGIDADCAHPGPAYVRFGVGDDRLRGWDFGQRSAHPDAYIGVPEPGGIAPTSCGALICLGMRRARR
ncbi:MAG: hypothetical protein AB7Q17_04220 [Phycisphaerae bacterium]